MIRVTSSQRGFLLKSKIPRSSKCQFYIDFPWPSYSTTFESDVHVRNSPRPMPLPPPVIITQGCGHGTAVPHVHKARQKGQQVTLAVRSRKTGLLSQGYLESIFEQKFMISTLWPFWEHTRYNPVNSFKVVQILQRDIYNEAPSLSRGLEGKTCISFAISGCQISLGRCQLAQKNKQHIS